MAVAMLLMPALAGAVEFRPPAVPLVTHDPYFSTWSMRDKLTDDFPHHWTGSIMGMSGIVRIDGKPYRIIGPNPKDVPALEQKALKVDPTTTAYQFEGGGVRIDLTFISPLLPSNLDLLSRPVTYILWRAQATDGKEHAVTAYLDATGEWAVDKVPQEVTAETVKIDGLPAARIGSKEQPVLQKKGDNLRIDWGHLYLAAPGGAVGVVAADVARAQYAKDGTLPETAPTFPRRANDEWPALAATIDFGKVGAGAPVARNVLIAYDDQFGIEYFQKHLRPYWRRGGMDAPAMLAAAAKELDAVVAQCAAFDAEVMKDLEAAGGAKYATLGALAYRQCIAAHKLVAAEDGTPLYFSKENFSNGCIATVDITYPSGPFFLLFNPTLLKGQLTPILDYAAMPRWKFPFAPHDLGTYPKANGQVYGGGEKTERDQMPVEECGNMLILVAALADQEGNAKYAERHWPILSKWANYLKEKGLDPENQLCTDDFAGHLAHNTNLSLKAIVALGGYARLCETLGKADDAKTYRAAAEEMAAKWVQMAKDGDHYKLTFDKAGTWSQKYNLVWDQLLGLKLFPADVRKAEVAYYKTKLQKYGLPLDSRKTYTKSDWIVWSATMADTREDFEALVNPIFTFAHESPSRVPFTDWYETTNGKMVGFQARSVVGGIYIKLLADPAMVAKWGKRAGR